jgi:hypothetical protein
LRVSIGILSVLFLTMTQFGTGQAINPPGLKPPAPAPAAAKAASDKAAKAKAAAKSGPDVIVFTNGDQLTGKLVSAVGGNVVFKSDMAGPLTISFDKIEQLRSGEEFALLRKGQPVNRKKPMEPVGTVAIADKNVTITPAAGSAAEQAPTVEAEKDVAYLVNKAEYDKEMNKKAAFTSGWNGTVTAGATLVRATTSNTTLAAGIALVRAVPDVPWLPARNRTTFDLTESYGKSVAPSVIPQTNPPTLPLTVTTLTSIFHADAERDEYFTARTYALADTAFDHNFAQGLQFQQIYGVGAGFTVIDNAKQELDLKADVHYELQRFIATPDMNLIGSTFFETYHRSLPRKIVMTETGSYIPAWNDLMDYAGNVTVALNLPVYKKLGATVSATDNYLNDPSPGYKKNSLQFITGLTYTLP